MNKKEQAIVTELVRASTVVLDQMLRGSHAPTRIQLAMLLDAIKSAVPLQSEARTDGLAVIIPSHLESLQKVIDGKSGWMPR